jgi:hypothetical protein
MARRPLCARAPPSLCAALVALPAERSLCAVRVSQVEQRGPACTLGGPWHPPMSGPLLTHCPSHYLPYFAAHCLLPLLTLFACTTLRVCGALLAWLPPWPALTQSLAHYVSPPLLPSWDTARVAATMACSLTQSLAHCLSPPLPPSCRGIARVAATVACGAVTLAARLLQWAGDATDQVVMATPLGQFPRFLCIVLLCSLSLFLQGRSLGP